MLRKLIIFIYKPYGMLLITVFMSGFFWAFPDFGMLRKGFEERQPILSLGGLLLLFWYSFCFAVSFIAFKVGNTIRIRSSKFDYFLSLENTKIYYFFTFIATIGIGYTYLNILQRVDFTTIYMAFTTGQGNILKIILYEDYSIGLFSFRYIVILASSIALFNIFMKNNRYLLLNIYNLILLSLLVIISHRLALIASIMISFGLYFYNSNTKISINYKWLLSLILIFVILAILNWFRNYNFYYNNYGIDNFLLSGFSEIMTYTGTGIQGGLSVGNHIDEFLNNRVLSSVDGSITGIGPSLSTNSAILSLFIRYNIFAFFVAFVAIGLTSLVMGMIYNHHHNYLAVLYFVLLYPFAEFWRLFFFDQGIFFTLLIVLIGTFFLARFTTVNRRRY